MNLMGIIGGGVVLMLGAFLVVRYFPNEVAEFWRRMGNPSENSIKKQSVERLAEMERNIAERKARNGR